MMLSLDTRNRDRIKVLFEEKYVCEELRENIENQELIKSFVGGSRGEELEHFLKHRAWNASENGESRVYIVKEKTSKIVRAYFSLKCGILYSPHVAEKIEGDDRELFTLILDAVRDGDEELLTEYESSNICDINKFNELCNEAQRVVDSEKETKENNAKHYDVKTTFPAVEIENLCKNYACEFEEIIPFGFLVFWLCVIPRIELLSKIAGCKYVYLFAADKSGETAGLDDEWNTIQKLVSYYRNSFNFSDTGELYFIRPEYDNRCHEMSQTIYDAITYSYSIWDQMEEIIDEIEVKKDCRGNVL